MHKLRIFSSTGLWLQHVYLFSTRSSSDHIYSLSHNLIKLTCHFLSYDSWAFLIVLLHHFTLSRSFMSISILELSPTSFNAYWSSGLTLYQNTHLTACHCPELQLPQLRTTCVIYGNRTQHLNFITQSQRDYRSSNCYIPYIKIISHKTLSPSILLLPIALFLSSITLGVCLFAFNLNHWELMLYPAYCSNLRLCLILHLKIARILLGCPLLIKPRERDSRLAW